ncbi:hypothetical protein BaRGS_00012895 [Batillaria attramentaria]|uniref:Uncharacterized protein n=1 Tax=Batillaria attramentaria TaxID=370345 RepID=A0ABD0L988_9CAEN
MNRATRLTLRLSPPGVLEPVAGTNIIPFSLPHRPASPPSAPPLSARLQVAHLCDTHPSGRNSPTDPSRRLPPLTPHTRQSRADTTTVASTAVPRGGQVGRRGEGERMGRRGGRGVLLNSNHRRKEV